MHLFVRVVSVGIFVRGGVFMGAEGGDVCRLEYLLLDLFKPAAEVDIVLAGLTGLLAVVVALDAALDVQLEVEYLQLQVALEDVGQSFSRLLVVYLTELHHEHFVFINVFIFRFRLRVCIQIVDILIIILVLTVRILILIFNILILTVRILVFSIFLSLFFFLFIFNFLLQDLVFFNHFSSVFVRRSVFSYLFLKSEFNSHAPPNILASQQCIGVLQRSIILVKLVLSYYCTCKLELILQIRAFRDEIQECSFSFVNGY